MAAEPRKGDPLARRTPWRELWLAAARSWRFLPPLHAQESAGQITARLALPPELDARITARSGQAYSWAEARRTAGAWTTLEGGRAGTANAFEYNGATDVPLGSIQRLKYTAAGDWRFARIATGPGRVDGPCDKPPLVGFAVELDCRLSDGRGAVCRVYRDGVLLGQCTTTSFGESEAPQCVVFLPADVVPGTELTWTIDHPQFGSFSGSVVMACGGVSVIRKLWGYDSLPSTLTLTDPVGNAITLTRGGAGADSRTWAGQFVYTSRITGLAYPVYYGWGAGYFQAAGTPAFVRGCAIQYNGAAPPPGGCSPYQAGCQPGYGSPFVDPSAQSLSLSPFLHTMTFEGRHRLASGFYRSVPGDSTSTSPGTVGIDAHVFVLRDNPLPGTPGEPYSTATFTVSL